MRQYLSLAGTIAVSVAVLVAAPAAIAQQAADNEAAIRQVIVEMTEGFNNHDGKAASRMYTQDARLVTVRGDVMSGPAEIEKGLSGIFATRARNATQRTMDVKIRLIKPDVAFAYVTNELSGLVAPDGRSLPAHQELSLRVFVKDGGVWQVAAFHNTMIAPFAPPAR
ncbi:SgcJ/EcaC family oxidoreductase [Bradyrhizobium sp. AUGA SZCCT0222]|uniref:YybH family protein n=1 Tax=Bradyrhizobium sp. AUGA SZCCT0222 TaxID=2807668 RepID=UPI001BA607A0|nr:SgcJ/EcaC family oxidoreductase [Bradyrhizobium sp. AUGA SZCCT0222]MBR1271319.1 SgcJ/EcaC family oxidoreductase [Bradyrhizobium sp. AUGA SZCCT0222]